MPPDVRTGQIRQVPWWKSTTMRAAYVGLLIAFCDLLVTLVSEQKLSWRTAVIAIGSAVAAWGRRNATTIVSSYLGLTVSDPQTVPPKPDQEAGEP